MIQWRYEPKGVKKPVKWCKGMNHGYRGRARYSSSWAKEQTSLRLAHYIRLSYGRSISGPGTQEHRWLFDSEPIIVILLYFFPLIFLFCYIHSPFSRFVVLFVSHYGCFHSCEVTNDTHVPEATAVDATVAVFIDVLTL